MNFSQGHSGTKVRYVNRACFPKEKRQNSQKNGRNSWTFRFGPFFGLPGRLLRLEQYSDTALPKGPFRTKNTTTIAKIVNYYAVVFLLRPPDLLRHGPFLERENVCNSQENGVHTRCAAIVVNHRAIVKKILRVVNLLRVVFLVRLDPLGN